MWSLSKSHTHRKCIQKLADIFGQKCCWLRCCSVAYIEWLAVTNCIYTNTSTGISAFEGDLTSFIHSHWFYVFFVSFLHLCWFHNIPNIRTVPYEKYFGLYSMFNWLFNWITLFRSLFLRALNFTSFFSQFFLLFLLRAFTHTITYNKNNDHM